MENNKKNLAAIKYEIDAVIENSCELDISKYENHTADQIIEILTKLKNNLNGQKIDNNFPEITSYFANLYNLGATYKSRETSINDASIWNIILDKICEKIQDFEKKFELNSKNFEGFVEISKFFIFTDCENFRNIGNDRSENTNNQGVIGALAALIQRNYPGFVCADVEYVPLGYQGRSV